MKKIMFKQEIPARPSLDSGVSPRQATLEAPMLPRTAADGRGVESREVNAIVPSISSA